MSSVRVAVLVGLVAAGVAGGWMLGSASDGRREIDELDRRLAAARAEGEAAEAEHAAARHDARAAEREAAHERRAAQAAEKRPPPASTQERAPSPTAAESDWRARVAASYPAFPFADGLPEVRDALVHVDWVAVAENMAGMVPVASEITSALIAGDPPSADAIGKSQAYNGPLVTIAIRLHANGVPGTGANGSFSHPAFMTNAIAATLEALAMPLSTDQNARLTLVGEDHARRERERLASPDPEAVALRLLVEEAEQKHDFFADAFSVVSPAQLAALRPAVVRGRIAADLFSEGLVWVGRAQPLLYRDQAHLAELVESRVLGDIDSATLERMRPRVAAWIAELPEALLSTRADSLDRMGMIDAEHATAWAREFQRLVELLLQDNDLDERSRSRLRDQGGALVPFHDTSE